MEMTNVTQKNLDDEQPKSESEELNLDKYGNFPMATSGKPEFDIMTRAKVKSAILMTSKDRKEVEKDGKKQVFYQVYLKVTYVVGDADVFESLGGGKLYVSETDGSSRFWLGENSALGKLATKMKEHLNFEGSLKDVPENIVGKEVGIKTTANEINGENYKKNLIEVFY